jgi:hypothetical protein
LRIGKIMRLLQACQFSIHDLSRQELDRTSGLPRFNMPLELGLELGLRHSGTKRLKRKRCLVLDREDYRYQRSLSDLAGVDPASHRDSPERAIIIVRDWLRTASRRADIPGGEVIVQLYDQFAADLPALAVEMRLIREQRPFLEVAGSLAYVDYATCVEEWLRWLRDQETTVQRPGVGPAGAAARRLRARRMPS